MSQSDSSEGLKSITTSMEIGLVRDVVDQVANVHDNLLKNQTLFGKVYGIGILVLCKGLIIADTVFRTSEELYTNNFPKFMVQKTHKAQVAVWSKWVEVDDIVSGTLTNQLKRYPFFGKTMSDIAGDVQNYLNESKIWNFTKKTTYITIEVVKKAIELARDPSKGIDSEDEEVSEDDDDDDEEPEPVVQKRKKSQKTKSQGTMTKTPTQPSGQSRSRTPLKWL